MPRQGKYTLTQYPRDTNVEIRYTTPCIRGQRRTTSLPT